MRFLFFFSFLFFSFPFSFLGIVFLRISLLFFSPLFFSFLLFFLFSRIKHLLFHLLFHLLLHNLFIYFVQFAKELFHQQNPKEAKDNNNKNKNKNKNNNNNNNKTKKNQSLTPPFLSSLPSQLPFLHFFCSPFSLSLLLSPPSFTCLKYSFCDCATDSCFSAC